LETFFLSHTFFFADVSNLNEPSSKTLLSPHQSVKIVDALSFINFCKRDEVQLFNQVLEHNAENLIQSREALEKFLQLFHSLPPSGAGERESFSRLHIFLQVLQVVVLKIPGPTFNESVLPWLLLYCTHPQSNVNLLSNSIFARLFSNLTEDRKVLFPHYLKLVLQVRLNSPSYIKRKWSDEN
jgi:hypothetical protein